VALDHGPGAFPWGTLVVNVVGCLLIGVAASRIERSTPLWSFTVTGLLGGFTTMSAFAVELNDLVDADRSVLAAVYLSITLTAGAVAFLVGERAGR
jgi:CrcB protein